MTYRQDFELCADFGAIDQIKAGNIRVTHLAGRCRSGNDQTGYISHVLVTGKALCGKAPGKKSAGWSEYNDTAPTCNKCTTKLETLWTNKWRCLDCGTEHAERIDAVECCANVVEVVPYSRTLLMK